VKDILLICYSNHTNIQTILNEFNTIHQNLEFTAETETDNNINFLDINIHRNASNWNISIYRKPTYTDTLIPYSSNHPVQHKFAAVRFLHNRLNTYGLSTDAYELEKQTIQNILTNNSFPNGLINTSNTSSKKRTQKTKDQLEKQKWATFTYTGKETTYITNTFRKTNIKIPFRTQNTIGNWLKPKHKTPDTYALSDIYRLSCPICSKAYVGQTGRGFSVRFKEHKHAFHKNSHTSKFARHLPDHNHPFGTIQNTMQILRHHRKGPHLNTLERFYIYAEYTSNNHLNDDHTIFPNRIFETLLKDHSRTNPSPTTSPRRRSSTHYTPDFSSTSVSM
jgi:hypothetical protein